METSSLSFRNIPVATSSNEITIPTLKQSEMEYSRRNSDDGLDVADENVNTARNPLDFSKYSSVIEKHTHRDTYTHRNSNAENENKTAGTYFNS
mgnify:CR=1 FL=1